MAMATDLEITLVNRPGTAAEVGEALGSAGVNIDGVFAHTTNDEGVAHVLVADAEGARAALAKAGIRIDRERQVVVTQCPDRPGEMGRVLRRLAQADVNLDILYLTTTGRLVVGAADLEHLSQVLS